MQIYFKNERDAQLFNKEKALVALHGKKIGRLIQRRMNLLVAAPTLADVPHKPPPRRHELIGKRKGQFAVDIDKKNRLIIIPDHNPVPRKKDGGLDLKKITEIKILGVEDYH